MNNHSGTEERLFSFVGGTKGQWRVTSTKAIVGEGLATPAIIESIPGKPPGVVSGSVWTLYGILSHARYTNAEEHERMARKQAPLGRPEATHAALIPIKKSAHWWALPQDKRREIFEASSKHISVGLAYLPAIARRLYHCRDLGGDQPFDFLTFFDFSASNTKAFDEMLAVMRASEEWQYVEREVDIRLERLSAAKIQ